jgi:hypothetical protein
MNLETGSIRGLLADLRGSILMDNWKLEATSWSPDTAVEALTELPDRMRDAIAARAAALGWPAPLAEALSACYYDRHSSGLVAAHAFALHLFRVAEDNWFSFGRAVEACRWFAAPDLLAKRRELWLAKGVRARELLPGLCVPYDLAIVADCGANELSFALIGLAD